jgi:hypothetical protein
MYDVIRIESVGRLQPLSMGTASIDLVSLNDLHCCSFHCPPSAVAVGNQSHVPFERAGTLSHHGWCKPNTVSFLSVVGTADLCIKLEDHQEMRNFQTWLCAGCLKKVKVVMGKERGGSDDG